MVVERIVEHSRKEGIRPTVDKIIRYLPRSVPPVGVPLFYRWKAWHNWKKSGNFSTRPYPLKIIRISPEQIIHNSKNRFSYLSDMYRDIGLVAGGEWDLSDQKFCEETIYNSANPNVTIYSGLKSHFKDGRSWKETEFIQNLLYSVKEDPPVWHGCESKQDIFDRCARLDELYDKIKNSGYKSRKDLSQEDNDHMRYIPKLNPMRFYYLYDEVVCNVGRDGEFLFVGGHHRLSIAKILNLDQIPVRIFVRHKKWQKKIDAFNETRQYKQSDHPDLKNS